MERANKCRKGLLALETSCAEDLGHTKTPPLPENI